MRSTNNNFNKGPWRGLMVIAVWPWPWIGSRSYQHAQHTQPCDSSLKQQRNMAPWKSCNVDILRSLKLYDSLLRRTFKKSGSNKLQTRSHTIIINHQFWAPRQNGRGDRPTKLQFLELQKLSDLDLDLGLGRKSYWCAHPVDVYPHTKSDRNWKTFFVDGRTDMSSNLLGHQWAMT